MSLKKSAHIRNRLAQRSLSIYVMGLCLASSTLLAQQIPSETSSRPAHRVPGWPAEFGAVEYLSAADNSFQPALFYDPGGTQAKPLLVALHSWSGNYTQANPAYGIWCVAKDWVLIHPDFRGVNQRPEACGSELVVQDILSAVEFAQKKAVVDIRRIYLVGASGGGYASLLMAGRAPDIWAGVSAWCPIYDLRTWHAETSQRQLKYCDMLETVCGGAPGESPEVDEQYRVRSAATWLPHAHNVTLSINTGITDGHNGSVPVSHTLNAFNALAIAHDRIAESAIQSMVQNPNMPVELLQRIDDPLYHSKPALFRRVSGSTQVTIFEGGHEIIYEAALGWLEQQVKGNDPVWLVKQVPEVDMRELDSQSGK